jgi:hypothetical protein
MIAGLEKPVSVIMLTTAEGKILRHNSRKIGATAGWIVDTANVRELTNT